MCILSASWVEHTRHKSIFAEPESHAVGKVLFLAIDFDKELDLPIFCFKWLLGKCPAHFRSVIWCQLHKVVHADQGVKVPVGILSVSICCLLVVLFDFLSRWRTCIGGVEGVCPIIGEMIRVALVLAGGGFPGICESSHHQNCSSSNLNCRLGSNHLGGGGVWMVLPCRRRYYLSQTSHSNSFMLEPIRSIGACCKLSNLIGPAVDIRSFLK